MIIAVNPQLLAMMGLQDFIRTVKKVRSRLNDRLQISGNTEDVMHHDDLHERFRSFGWHVIDVKNGNSIEELDAAFEEAKTLKGKPTVLIANTVKGCGSSVMENKASWHHHVPGDEEYEQIMKDLEERKEAALK